MKNATIFAGVLGCVLMFPAVLFMAALVIRNLPPHEVANLAQGIVSWYAGRLWTLWLLLFALPFVVLIVGCMALFRTEPRTQRGKRLPLSVHNFVAALTLSTASVLVIVVLHILKN